MKWEGGREGGRREEERKGRGRREEGGGGGEGRDGWWVMEGLVKDTHTEHVFPIHR